MEQEIVGL